MKILITAGGTREYIDPVRFISNASTGKMGYAIARAAMRAGHDVVLITAPTSLRKPAGAEVVDVQTSSQMFDAVKAHFADCDCLIMAAAVSDYTPAKKSSTKIKKSQTELSISLKLTRDILKWAGNNKSANQKVIGFALEDRSIKENAESKLQKKKLDMIVANSPAAISADRSTVHIKTVDDDWVAFTNLSKSIAASRILKMIESLR